MFYMRIVVEVEPKQREKKKQNNKTEHKFLVYK